MSYYLFLDIGYMAITIQWTGLLNWTDIFLAFTHVAVGLLILAG